MNLKAIATRIDQAVEKSGKSNDVIAGECGLKSGESVRLWRIGKTVPLLKNIQAFANVVEASADWILVGYFKDDVVSVSDLPSKDVEMSKRIAGLQPEIRRPLEMMINELTTNLSFEYVLNPPDVLKSIPD